MLAYAGDLGVQYKTSFELAHKMREAIASEVRQTAIGGEGKRAEVDGGYVKPANRRENRRDRRLRQNQSGKRKVVVVIRERVGKTLPGVFRSEIEALSFIRRQVATGTALYADEAGSWNEIHARYTLCIGSTITRRTASAVPTRSTSVRRRASLVGCAVLRSTITIMWPAPTCFASRKRLPGARIVAARRTGRRIVALAMHNKPSVDFCGY